jgi:hypothetical protein
MQKDKNQQQRQDQKRANRPGQGQEQQRKDQKNPNK